MNIFEEVAQKYGKPEGEVSERVEIARRAIVPRSERILVSENGVQVPVKVTREGVGPLNTRFGEFNHFSFSADDKWGKYSVLVMAELGPDFHPRFTNQENLFLRIDSGCETGQLFGDRTCECLDQLELCLKKISEKGEGMVVHVPRQDGRGLGLPFKLATLRLQAELGVDTVEASALLDPDGSRDVRTYAGVIAVLKYLGVPTETTIQLASNNPKKKLVFNENGYKVSELEPMVVAPNEFTVRHLRAKQKEFGHINLVTDGVAEDTSELASQWANELREVMERKGSVVCCGLDPDLRKMPARFRDTKTPELAILDFLTQVVDVVLPHVCAFKIQKAFFDLYPKGHDLLKEVIAVIKERDSGAKVIIDSKVGDIDNTMEAYLETLFRLHHADAVVLNPYMGTDVWEGLRTYPDKAALLLVRTSNPGGAIIQDLRLSDGKLLWERVLDIVVQECRRGLTLIPVVSSRSGKDLKKIRTLVPDSLPIFLAGVGAQAASIDSVRWLKDSSGTGIVVNSSRALLYPYRPDDANWLEAIKGAVYKMKTEINILRQ